MAMNRLIIVRGPTKSGKSSIIQELCKQLDFKAVYIDEIGKKIPREPFGHEPLHWARYGYILCEAYNKIVTYFKNDQDVILEEAFAEHPYIDCLLHLVVNQLKKEYELEELVFFIWCPVDVALERNPNSKQVQPEELIRHQHDRFIEGNDFGIKIDTSSMSLRKAVVIIKKYLAQNSW